MGKGVARGTGVQHMTQAEFKDLPMLLTRQRALAVLGCNRETLTCLRQQFPTLALRMPGMRHWRYRKVVVAKIAGIVYE